MAGDCSLIECCKLKFNVGTTAPGSCMVVDNFNGFGLSDIPGVPHLLEVVMMVLAMFSAHQRIDGTRHNLVVHHSTGKESMLKGRFFGLYLLDLLQVEAHMVSCCLRPGLLYHFSSMNVLLLLEND